MSSAGLGSLAGGDVPHVELAVGAGAALLMAIAWSILQYLSPREKLAIDDGAQGLTSATEDELFRVMPNALRATSLLLRCTAVALETVGDVLLLFVFLPSRLEGLDAPSARPANEPSIATGLAALVYGSQHLRFRHEWLLCTAFGVALASLAHAFDGSLVACLVAAELFAVGRHARRTGTDVRRAHAQ